MDFYSATNLLFVCCFSDSSFLVCKLYNIARYVTRAECTYCMCYVNIKTFSIKIQNKKNVVIHQFAYCLSVQTSHSNILSNFYRQFLTSWPIKITKCFRKICFSISINQQIMKLPCVKLYLLSSETTQYFMSKQNRKYRYCAYISAHGSKCTTLW